MSVLLTGKDELLSYFGINDVRYQPFETYYTIRKLSGGCLETGDKLFRPIFKRLHLNDIGFRETAKNKPTKIDHYHLKGYFYKTADFGISYTPDDSRKSDTKTSIKFRVALKGVKIGGSLNYEDLGLDTDSDVEKFIRIFHGLRDVRPLEEAIRLIAQRIVESKGAELYRAMAREIQEEGTPDRTVAKSIRTIVNGLRFTGIRLDKRASWQTVVNFEFESDVVYAKVREMDEFCCNMGGKVGEVDAYFIYGPSGKTYMSQLPYTLPAASPVAVKKDVAVTAPLVPMTATVNYMKSLSPSRREEAKGVLASFKPVRAPLKPKIIEYVPSHMYSVEGIKKQSMKAEKAGIHSLRDAKESLNFRPPAWKPIEPYLDVLRNYETDSDEDIVGVKKKQKTRKKSPTAPQRRTVRRQPQDKKSGSK